MFNVRIPEAKKENPNDPFYQNLEKWVTFVSFMRFYPDSFFRLITPKEGGIKLGLDQCIMLRGLARFKHLYDVQGRGSGKCVSYDTMLFTEDGIVEIGSLFGYNKTKNEEIIVNQNVGMINMYGQVEYSNKGIISGYKDTRIIKTREGIEIETSLNHPLLVMNKYGNLEYKQSKDLSIGDFLAISRNNNLWGKQVELEVNMEDWFENIPKRDRHKHIKGSIELPKKMTKELALILGYLVGDGTMTRNNVILFTNKDEDILKRYIDFMEKEIGASVKQCKSGIDYVIHGIYYREYFRQLGLDYVDAFEKQIPKSIMKAPKEFVVEFLKGLFDTDGCVEKNQVTFCSASKKLARQVQLVLLNFGIISKVYKKHNKKYKTDSYNLVISGIEIEKYQEYIGFSCERKSEKLNEICSTGKKRNTNVDVIPFQKERITKLYELAKSENTSDFGRSMKHIRSGANQLTYTKLNSLINDWNYNEESEEVLNELISFKELNYFYSPILEIEESSNYVCDLQMPKTHSFIGNGIVNHNTFLEQLYCYHTLTWYPNCDISMSAQTLANASSLVRDKFNEIMKFYPMLKNECVEKECRFTDNNTIVTWKNGSTLTTLANAQSSKGNRKKRLIIEESCQCNEKLYEDVLEPIVNVPRRTIGKYALISPIENNGTIHFFTTSWYKNTSEWHRNIKFYDDMCNLKGVFALGSSWELNALFGRGEPKSVVMQKKENLSPTMFALNYMSEWVGATTGALIPIDKVMALRNVTRAELQWDGKSEYIISCDVARSENKENNQSSIVVLKLIKNKNGKLVNVICVNIINYPSTVNFQTLAINLMKLKALYNAKVVIVDANGLGVGLVDECLKEQFDPITNESLGCWNTINTEQEPEIPYAEECLYALKSQQINHDIIVNFTNYIESEKLKLLEKRQDSGFIAGDDNYVKHQVLPFAQTDLLLEEIANLKLVTSERNGKLSVERMTRKVDKDRYSALAYGLYYIKLYEENDYIIDTCGDASDFCLVN